MSRFTKYVAMLPFAALVTLTLPLQAQEILYPPSEHYGDDWAEPELGPEVTRRPFSGRLSLGVNIINIATLPIVGAEVQLALGGLSTARRVAIYGVAAGMEGVSFGGLRARQWRVGVEAMGVVDERFYIGGGLFHHYAVVEPAPGRGGSNWAIGFGAVGVLAADLVTEGVARPFIEVRPELSVTNLLSRESALLVPGGTLAFGVHFVEL